jgi:YHS domain-containing protein
MESPQENVQKRTDCADMPACSVCGRQVAVNEERVWTISLAAVTYWLCSFWCAAKFEECPELFRSPE